MFLRFFLSFTDSQRSGFSVGRSRAANQASDAPDFKIPLRQRTTFGAVLATIAAKMDRRTQYLNNYYHSREILVNLSEESMFQLETLCVSEYCYCTYNLETKMIGFGNTIREAYDASTEIGFPGVSIGGVSNSTKPNYMIRFYKEKPEKEKMEYTCPDGFYEQVLNELKPYIVFEKNFFFKNCTDILEREGQFLDEVIDNYYDTTIANQISYHGSTLHSTEFKYTVKMFMEDDPDILQNKDYHESGFRLLGAMCLKIMLLTDETF